MEDLLNQLDQVIVLNETERQRVMRTFRPVSLAKGEFWLQQGMVCNHVAFLSTGKLRVHYLDESGQEVTCHFFTAGHFISSYTSFLTNAPSVESISAIEPAQLWIIHKKDLESLSTDVPAMHIWRRIVAENLFIAMEKRISKLQSKTAGERYELLIKENPDIALTVPLQYTASFLGITPQHLSRLRKEATR
jgi:CRP-like cAMP-binding protein